MDIDPTSPDTLHDDIRQVATDVRGRTLHVQVNEEAMRKVTYQRLSRPGEEDKPTAERQGGGEYIGLQKRDVICEWLRRCCCRGRCMPFFVAALLFAQTLLGPLKILRSNAPPSPSLLVCR